MGARGPTALLGRALPTRVASACDPLEVGSQFPPLPSPRLSGSHHRRYFDGEGDYVELGAIGTFDTLTIECWVKFFSTQGNHPIMNEDNWDVGDLHYQIYSSTFGFDVHPRGGDSGDTGDFTFGWQPSTNEWYFISVVYSSTAGCFSVGAPCIELNVNNELVETSSAANPIHGPPISV